MLFDLVARAAPRASRTEPLTLAEVRAELRPRELLLYVVWAPDVVSVVAVPSGAGEREESSVVGATVLEGLGRVVEVEGRLGALADELAERPNGARDELRREIAAAGELLLPDRVAELVAGAERVVLVADGPASRIPPALLFASAADRLPAFVLTGSATLLAGARSAGGNAAGGRALLLGDPEHGRGELEPLPGTRFEVETIGPVLRGAGLEVVQLVGADATLERLERELVDTRILHLATHGFAGDPERPYDARLVLADGADLTLERLVDSWGGRLPACDLVVLSACDSRRGAQVGDSRMALPWGFFHAGAKSVLATLWPVDDDAGALLMQRFYANVSGAAGSPREVGGRAYAAGERLPADHALLEAQTWLSTAGRRELRGLVRSGAERGEPSEVGGAGRPVAATAMVPYADPYFWAGFTLVGAVD